MRVFGHGAAVGQAFAAELLHAVHRANVSRPWLGAILPNRQVAAAKGPTCNCA